MEEAIDDNARAEDYTEEKLHTFVINELVALKKAIVKETETRTKNDMRSIAGVQESMEKLQNVVLENFGTKK